MTQKSRTMSLQVSLLFYLSCGLVTMAGCQSKTPTPIEVSTAAKNKALEARDELFKTLSTRLMEAVAESGPAGAIEVCSREALELTERVGIERGVKIGRSSLKLRNSRNQAPAWAKGGMDITRTNPQFLPLDNGATGAILPIFLKPQCLACHGPQEQLAEGVADKLAELYPNDQATGFVEGDLRGWFWIEVPAELPE